LSSSPAISQVRSERFPVESCRFQVIVELATHEYSKRAVAIPAPVSVTAILVKLAVPVVVVIIHVDVITGVIRSIQSTVAKVLPVFPTISANVKLNDPLSVNKYPVAFCPVSISDQLSIPITLPLVRLHETGVYIIVAVGISLSIHVTSPVALHVLPTRSEKVKINIPLPVNVYHVAFIPVTVSLNPVSIAMTSWLVSHVVEYSTRAVGLL
jgi:hypothetical protein